MRLVTDEECQQLIVPLTQNEVYHGWNLVAMLRYLFFFTPMTAVVTCEQIARILDLVDVVATRDEINDILDRYTAGHMLSKVELGFDETTEKHGYRFQRSARLEFVEYCKERDVLVWGDSINERQVMRDVPNHLVDTLSDLIDDRQAIKYFAERAHLPLGMVDLAGPPKIVWHRILKEALKHEVLNGLLDAVAEEFPTVNWKVVRNLVANAGQNTVRAPTLSETEWNSCVSPNELEKITGSQPTFLPLSFFEHGQLRARSVVLVQLPNGSGSGFLIEDNLLLTNHHVIGDSAVAKVAKITFNYQAELDGTPASTATFSLNPDKGFATSIDHDWTVVRIDGDANADWGAITLNECSVSDGDYVNIIQHPMGGPKVIALYHNVVVFSDADRFQYLTDTLPGSSGSPVFRSDWSLVGIHHAGGSFGKDGKIRNQGITTNRLIMDLRKHGYS